MDAILGIWEKVQVYSEIWFRFFYCGDTDKLRGGRYLGYIVKPQYSDVTIPVSSKILGNDIIVIS